MRIGRDREYGGNIRLHHNNLWSKYASGMHMPGADTIQACEAALPGSGELISDAAWAALNVGHSLCKGGDALLKLEKGRFVRRRAPIQPLQRLEGQAGLQAIAATVVLLREAHEAGNRSRAFEIGRSLHRTLLMAALASKLGYIQSELFEFFIRWIFPLAADDEVEMDLDRKVLATQAYRLDRTVMGIEDTDRLVYLPGGHTRQLRRLLQIDYGLDLFYGLGPRLKLSVRAERASSAARRYVASHNVAWEWGVKVLSDHRRQRMIPDDVLDSMYAPAP